MMCSKCFKEVDELFEVNCKEKPELVTGIGQYHCPDCGVMVLGGCPHPKICKQCKAEEKEKALTIN